MSWGLFVLHVIVLTVLTVGWWASPGSMSIKRSGLKKRSMEAKLLSKDVEGNIPELENMSKYQNVDVGGLYCSLFHLSLVEFFSMVKLC